MVLINLDILKVMCISLGRKRSTIEIIGKKKKHKLNYCKEVDGYFMVTTL